MKCALVLLVLMPFVLSMEVDKRGILDFLNILGFGNGHLLNLDLIKETAQHILDTLGSDATETQCENSCHSFLAVDEGHLVHTLCTPLCRSFQKVVGLFGLIPGIGK